MIDFRLPYPEARLSDSRARRVQARDAGRIYQLPPRPARLGGRR